MPSFPRLLRFWVKARERSSRVTLHQNAGAAVRLPPEIIYDILFALDRFEDRLSASQICRHWRAGALSFLAQFWSDITTAGRHPQAFRAQLERARNIPVSVSAQYRVRGSFFRTSGMLFTHMNHILRLTITVDRRPSILDVIMDVLRGCKAPVLQELKLTLVPSRIKRGWVFIPSDDIFARFAPQLWSVSLDTPTRFRRGCPSAFRNVDVLYITHDDDTHASLDAIASLPNLRHFSMVVRAIPLAPPSPPQVTVFPTSLTTLGLYIFGVPAPWLPGYFSAKHVRNLSITYYDGVYEEVHPDYESSPSRNVRMCLATAMHSRRGTLSMYLLKENGAFLCVVGAFALPAFPAFFDYLTELTVDEAVLPVDVGDDNSIFPSSVPVLPLVRTLVIILALTLENATYASAVHFPFDCRIPCFPSLDHLVFQCPHDYDPLTPIPRYTLSPADINLFVMHCSGGRRLSSIELRKVDLHAHAGGAEYGRLFQSVDDLVVLRKYDCSVPVSWIPVVERGE
ncbi:hypothetical protein EXIGLDRAFT_196520 [Exidia glandulosa HHB12029]|uniref:F-box domain-containing protein n=1 Tax=Exidia glandulosa HHB12029 TaxID=1314781 RepID=A0A165EUB8_EXIGL|nr:hypothetical protein EXIGLDRAFT_196520 [Exidia glandulosa HHB12029]